MADMPSLVICMRMPMPDDTMPVFDWCFGDNVGLNHTIDDLKSALEADLHQLPVTISVPAETMFSAEISIPVSANDKQLQQGLPFMVEDYLMTDISKVHLVRGRRTRNGKISVLALSQESVSTLLEWTELHELNVELITSDCMLLERVANSVTVFVEAERCLVRVSDDFGFAVQPDNLSFYLKLLINEEVEKPGKIVLISSEDLSAQAGILVADINESINIEASAIIDDRALVALHQQALLLDIPCINIRQGAYAPSNRRYEVYKQWGVVAVTLVFCLLLKVITDLSTYTYFQNKAEDAEGDSIALYQSLFPDQSRIVNPKGQMFGYLSSVDKAAKGTNANTFTNLFSATLTELNRLQVKGELKLNYIKYDAGKEDIIVEFFVSDIALLNQYKELLEASGLSGEIISANNDTKNIIAVVKVYRS